MRLDDLREGLVPHPAGLQGGWQVHQLLVAQLPAHPPQLVVGRAEPLQRFAVAGEVVEVAAFLGLQDLALDEVRHGLVGWLALGHATEGASTSTRSRNEGTSACQPSSSPSRSRSASAAWGSPWTT